MAERELKGGVGGLIALARLRRRRCRGFLKCAEDCEGNACWSFMPTPRRKARAAAYRKLAARELREAKQLESRAKLAVVSG